jgi:hypothetical protein
VPAVAKSETDIKNAVPNRDYVIGDWRMLYSEELPNLYSSSNVVRVIKSTGMRQAEHRARKAEIRNAHKILVGKPEEKGPIGKTRYMWEGNIKMDLREIGWGGIDWMNLAQDRDH